MKANDNIPADEMLLAEAIAAAKARGLGWCSGRPFKSERDKYGGPDVGEDIIKLVDTGEIKSCCAMGALALAGRITIRQSFYDNGGVTPPDELANVYYGNDRPDFLPWGCDDDNGESLGWAFRCAMTQEDE